MDITMQRLFSLSLPELELISIILTEKKAVLVKLRYIVLLRYLVLLRLYLVLYHVLMTVRRLILSLLYWMHFSVFFMHTG